jgi:hypothetical protein
MIKFVVCNVDNFDGIDGIDAQVLCKKNIREAKKKINETKKFKLEVDGTKITNSDLFMKNVLDLFGYYKEKVSKNPQSDEAYVYVKKETASEELKEFFNVLSMQDVNQRNSYIYDLACDYFDDLFREKDLCAFKDDACSCQRACKTKHTTMGCCYAFYYRKYDRMPVYTGECPHLTPTGCDTKCLGCKIFSCRYLKSLGYKFKSDDYFLLRTFLNKKQKNYTDNTYFKTKDEVLEGWNKLSK